MQADGAARGELEHHGARGAAERGAVVQHETVFRRHGVAGSSALHIVLPAVEAIHFILVGNHAPRGAGRIPDHANGNIRCRIRTSDLDETRLLIARRPVDLEKGDIRSGFRSRCRQLFPP